MNKICVYRYFNDLAIDDSGQRYTTIFRYLYPELITAFILYSFLNLIDAHFVAGLQSTSLYAAQGITNTLMHFITKIIEGFSVGTIILCGQYNGKGDYQSVGKAAISAFWVTFIIGIFLTALLYGTAEFIYYWYQVPAKIAQVGARFLSLRALSIFFSCLYLTLIGFLRGIKNTRVPMYIFLGGAVIFIFFDYALIFGAFGFPALKLKGSALASIIHYAAMSLAALVYILWHDRHRFNLHLFKSFDLAQAGIIMRLSWPVMIDKATLAAAKVWLSYLIASMGKTELASFTVIKDMEQLAIVPGIACAQVITFLVSNDYGSQNWHGIKINIKRLLFIACALVFALLCIFSYLPETIIACFDKKGSFIHFAATAFPLISFFVIFDILQLILSAALRGAADVKTVMHARFLVTLCFFIPLSYIVAILPIESSMVKFIMIYSSLYIGNALMSIVYFIRLRGTAWKQITFNPARIADDQNYPQRDSQTRPDVTT